jgi:hypothetical protein
VLLFDDFDRQCANHFLARKVALVSKEETLKALRQTQRQEDAAKLRIIAEGWSLLAEAQSALAHTCMFMLTVRSAKLSFLFESQKLAVLALQQRFEETWTSLDAFPSMEAKASIRDLQGRLRDFLLSVHMELVTERKRKSAAAVISVARSTPSSPTKTSPSRRSAAHRESANDVAAVADKLQDLIIGGVFSHAEVREVAATVFGDAFGSCWHSYSSSLSSHHLRIGEESGCLEHEVAPVAVESNNPLNFFQNNFIALMDEQEHDTSKEGPSEASLKEEKSKRSRL